MSSAGEEQATTLDSPGAGSAEVGRSESGTGVGETDGRGSTSQGTAQVADSPAAAGEHVEVRDAAGEDVNAGNAAGDVVTGESVDAEDVVGDAATGENVDAGGEKVEASDSAGQAVDAGDVVDDATGEIVDASDAVEQAVDASAPDAAEVREGEMEEGVDAGNSPPVATGSPSGSGALASGEGGDVEEVPRAGTLPLSQMPRSGNSTRRRRRGEESTRIVSGRSSRRLNSSGSLSVPNSPRLGLSPQERALSSWRRWAFRQLKTYAPVPKELLERPLGHPETVVVLFMERTKGLHVPPELMERQQSSAGSRIIFHYNVSLFDELSGSFIGRTFRSAPFPATGGDIINRGEAEGPSASSSSGPYSLLQQHQQKAKTADIEWCTPTFCRVLLPQARTVQAVVEFVGAVSLSGTDLMQVSLGWTCLDLFLNAAQLPEDPSGESAPTSKTSLFVGTPRSLLSMALDRDETFTLNNLPRVSGSMMEYRVTVHPSLKRSTPYWRPYEFYGLSSLVPGLATLDGDLTDFVRGRLARAKELTISRIKVLVDVRWEASFMDSLERLRRTQQGQFYNSAAKIRVLERKLLISPHNTILATDLQTCVLHLEGRVDARHERSLSAADTESEGDGAGPSSGTGGVGRRQGSADRDSELSGSQGSIRRSHSSLRSSTGGKRGAARHTSGSDGAARAQEDTPLLQLGTAGSISFKAPFDDDSFAIVSELVYTVDYPLSKTAYLGGNATSDAATTRADFIIGQCILIPKAHQINGKCHFSFLNKARPSLLVPGRPVFRPTNEEGTAIRSISPSQLLCQADGLQDLYQKSLPRPVEEPKVEPVPRAPSARSVSPGTARKRTQRLRRSKKSAAGSSTAPVDAEAAFSAREDDGGADGSASAPFTPDRKGDEQGYRTDTQLVGMSGEVAASAARAERAAMEAARALAALQEQQQQQQEEEGRKPPQPAPVHISQIVPVDSSHLRVGFAPVPPPAAGHAVIGFTLQCSSTPRFQVTATSVEGQQEVFLMSYKLPAQSSKREEFESEDLLWHTIRGLPASRMIFIRCRAKTSGTSGPFGATLSVVMPESRAPSGFMPSPIERSKSETSVPAEEEHELEVAQQVHSSSRGTPPHLEVVENRIKSDEARPQYTPRSYRMADEGVLAKPGRMERSDVRRLMEADLPELLNEHGVPLVDVGYLTTPIQDLPKALPLESVDEVLEFTDPLDVNDMVVQFWAFSPTESLVAEPERVPKRIHFSMRFFWFPLVYTRKVPLLVLPRSAEEGHSSADPMFFLHHHRPAHHSSAAEKTSKCGLELRHRVERNAMSREEFMEFVQFMSLRTMVIEVWDSDSQCVLGRVHFPLRQLLRQKREGVKQLLSCPIISGIDAISGQQSIVGKLHLRVANIGSVSGRVSGKRPNTVAAKRLTQVHREISHVVAEVKGIPGQVLEKVEEFRARPEVSEAAAAAAARSTLTQVVRMTASLGKAILYEARFDNPREQPAVFHLRILDEHETQELRFVRDPAEWALLRDISEVQENASRAGKVPCVERLERLFDQDDYVTVYSKETLFVPMVFRTVNHVNDVPIDRLHSHGGLVRPPIEVEVYDRQGQLCKIFRFEVEVRPHAVDSHFRFYTGPNQYFRKCLCLRAGILGDAYTATAAPPGPDQDPVSAQEWNSSLTKMLGQPQSMMTGTGLIEQRYGMTSIPDAQASCRRRKDASELHMVDLRARCGHAGENMRFFVMLYSDQFRVNLTDIWEIILHVLPRVNVSSTAGQPSSHLISLPLMSENCTVRFLSSSPEIKVRADTGLSDVAITANARQSVELEFRPLLAGSSEHLLNGVDSNSGLVRFSFLVACHATDPVIDYKFELSLPLGVDAKRKISFKNPSTQRKIFRVMCSAPHIVSIQHHTQELDLEPLEKGWIRLKFHARDHPCSHQMLLYVHDEFNKLEQCIHITANYEAGVSSGPPVGHNLSAKPFRPMDCSPAAGASRPATSTGVQQRSSWRQERSSATADVLRPTPQMTGWAAAAPEPRSRPFPTSAASSSADRRWHPRADEIPEHDR